MVAFPLVDEPGVSMIAWTTTPWTLPSNLSLCVNPKMTYVKVQGKKLIFSQNIFQVKYSFKYT